MPETETLDPTVHTTDRAQFRTVLGNVPTSVAIVTGHDAGPFGIVVGSLVSISLKPPLVGLFIDSESSTLRRLLKCDRICINVLSAEQAGFCRDFSKNRSGRFTCGSWRLDEGAAPQLKGALAWISGPIERSVEIGDHHLIVVRTETLAENPTCSRSQPLVFFRGTFAA